MGRPLGLTNRRFGKLTALHVDTDNQTKRRKWICQCDCGNIVSVSTENLTNGNSKSCGCTRHKKLMERNVTHGLSKTADYRFWRDFMKQLKRNGSEFDPNWNTFESFHNDMGHRPDKKSVGRLDISKPYAKENCRWMERKDIENVRSNSTLIEYSGETHTFSGWAKKLGIKQETLSSRYKNGVRPPELFNRSTIAATRKKPDTRNTVNRKKSIGRPRNKTVFTYDSVEGCYTASIDGVTIKVSACDLSIVEEYHWRISDAGYVETHCTENGKYRRVFMHRLVLGLKDAFWKNSIVDHVNEDKTDNRRENLRLADAATNQINRRNARKDNSSGHVGVYKEKEKWRVQINGKYCGVFATYDEAVEAREQLEREKYGDFAPHRG